MTQPVIVLTGQPIWEDTVRRGLEPAYSVVALSDKSGYVKRLAEMRPALVLVDGKEADWSYWVTTPKTSPATRRIPVVLVASDSRLREAARSAGADAVISTSELAVQPAQLVEQYARVIDTALLEALECGCAETLPPLATEGVAQFNAGHYYRQHDLFEEQWVQTDTPIRDLYRAILQVGVAYYQIERGNHRGALKMLLRSIQWLAPLPDVCQGIDIRQLRLDSEAVRAALEQMNPADIGHFDSSLFKPIRLVDPSRA